MPGGGGGGGGGGGELGVLGAILAHDVTPPIGLLDQWRAELGESQVALVGVLPDMGSEGRQRGLGGHVKFADRDLEEKWPKFPLFLRHLGPISLRIGPFPP